MCKPSVGFAMRESEGWVAFARGSIRRSMMTVVGEKIAIVPRIDAEEKEPST